MSEWFQHILVLLIVAGAMLVLVRQALATFRGRGGKLGSCCAKGCDAHSNPKPSGERIAFLPVDSLTRSRRS
jgi:hypothetical protein